MRLSESGKITLKALLSLAFLAASVFVAFKTIPVYINDYQLNDYIQNQTPFWQTQHASEEAIRKTIILKAQDLGFTLDADDMTVEATPNKVTVTLDYHVPVDLKVYTLQLHFTHSAENRAI